jgi:hypothetical protein
MLLLAPLIGLMPQATLAAVVIYYSVGLIDPAAFRHILHIRRTEFFWALAALAGVVLLGTLKGILVAISRITGGPGVSGGRSTGQGVRSEAGDQRVPATIGRAAGR